MIDKSLVLETLAEIEVSLDRWDQEEYVNACGTTMCFGGWAMSLRGYKPVKAGQFGEYSSFEAPDGRKLISSTEVEAAAMEVLGFDDRTAFLVFHWQPDDYLPCDPETFEVLASKWEQFEAFRNHVMAVTGITGDTGV